MPKLWLASALLLVAGCGGSDADRARDVATKYAEAFADGDYATACGQTTAPGPDCEAALKVLHAGDVPTEVQSVKVTGDRATADFGPGTMPVPLEKRDGEWRVAIASG
jgi:hypothetical protein